MSQWDLPSGVTSCSSRPATTLSTDKHELQRKVDACLTEHDSLLASFQNLERESESKLQDAQNKRDECLEESKKEKGRHDKLLKEANEKHNKCLEDLKNGKNCHVF